MPLGLPVTHGEVHSWYRRSESTPKRAVSSSKAKTATATAAANLREKEGQGEKLFPIHMEETKRVQTCSLTGDPAGHDFQTTMRRWISRFLATPCLPRQETRPVDHLGTSTHEQKGKPVK